MQDWSPALLQAMNGVLDMYLREVGLQSRPAPVLEIVRNRKPSVNV